jgi:2-keto-4-pentenoate hydratase
MRVDVDAAAEDLWFHAERGDHAPGRWGGVLTYQDGLAVQLCHLDRKVEAGEQLAGWKVGLTSPRAREMIGADERPFGHLLRSKVFASGDEVAAGSMHEPHIEPELCFVFARPVDEAQQLREAVGSVHAAFELNENRPGTVSGDFPLTVADNMAQWGIVIGQGADPRSLDLDAVAVELRCDGEVLFEGVSGDLIDDHWDSLARLVGELGRHSRRIEAGHRVITGAFCRLPAAAGQRWEATFSRTEAERPEVLGTVDVTFV